MGEDVATKCICPNEYSIAPDCDIHRVTTSRTIEIRMRIARCVICKELSGNWWHFDGEFTCHDKCLPALAEKYPDEFHIIEEIANEF